MKRNWTHARLKCDREGRCRLCRRSGRVEAAHTIGRSYDDKKTGVVDPDAIIPLCNSCHRGYDQRKLSVLAVLSLDEQAYAARHMGLLRALHRVDPTGGWR